MNGHWKLPWLNWASVAMIVDTAILSTPYFVQLNWNWMVELLPLIGGADLACFTLLGLAVVVLFTLWLNWVAWDRYSHRNVTASVHYGGGSRSIGSGYSPGYFYYRWDKEDLSNYGES